MVVFLLMNFLCLCSLCVFIFVYMWYSVIWLIVKWCVLLCWICRNRFLMNGLVLYVMMFWKIDSVMFLISICILRFVMLSVLFVIVLCSSFFSEWFIG